MKSISYTLFILGNDNSTERIKFLENAAEKFQVSIYADYLYHFAGIKPLRAAEIVQDERSVGHNWGNSTFNIPVKYQLDSLATTPSEFNIEPIIKDRFHYEMTYDIFSMSIRLIDNLNVMRQYANGLTDYYLTYSDYMHDNTTHFLYEFKESIDQVCSY